MPPNPSEGEARLDNLFESWEEIAPTAVLFGMTLTQAKAKVKPSLETRATIKQLDKQRKVAQVERDVADVSSLAFVQDVVNAVKGDPNFGEDSALYAALGYVRKSDRKSGLTRASHDAPVSIAKAA